MPLEGHPNPNEVYFDFYPSWSSYSYNNVHGAKGGDGIVMVAAGLRTRVAFRDGERWIMASKAARPKGGA